MVPTGLGPWKMEPSDQDLTRFLRVKKQKLPCPPIAALLAPETLPHVAKETLDAELGSKQVHSDTTHGRVSNHTVTKQQGKPPEKTVFIDTSETDEAPILLKLISSSAPTVTTTLLQSDFLLEGLLTEWRTRRKQLFKEAPTAKLSNRSFFPQQHKQIKYWAWPFLGIMVLTSSLPLVRSDKQPISSISPFFKMTVDAENGEPQNESEALLFDKLAYTPNEALSHGNKLFDQTLSLGLATNELDVGQNSAPGLKHPMANFDYSKMLLDLLVKKSHCHSFKAKPGYVSNLAFTTNELKSYLPKETQVESVTNVLPTVLKFLRLTPLTDNVKYSPTFMLPYLTARENWDRSFDPVYYRLFTENLMYKYLHHRLSTEADLYRRQRKSVQFAARPVDQTLKLEASFKELHLLKQLVTPLQTKKVNNKRKAKVKTKAWKSAMDSKQWLSSFALHAQHPNENGLIQSQPSSGMEAPRNVSLLSKDWPTFPNQFTQISKSLMTQTDLDPASFLNPLPAARHPIPRLSDLANSNAVTETVQNLFPEVRKVSRASHRLSDWLSPWLTNWSRVYSTREGVINDATFSKQFSPTPGRSSSEKFNWARPIVEQNTQYEALARTDSVTRSELTEQLFRGYLTYKNTSKIPPSVPPVSREFTLMLERSQGSLSFNYPTPNTAKKVKKRSHPTTGALLKTFVFRSPSYFEDPDLQDKRTGLKRRRSNRYKRAGISRKKRRRISPRPKWLRSSLYSSFIKVRHPGTLPDNRVLTITTQRAGQIKADRNLENDLNLKRVNSGTPSLFRQKGLYHSLMRNMPQLGAGKFLRMAKWAKPRSFVTGWRAFLVANEFTPYTRALNTNFKKLEQRHVVPQLTHKLCDMPHWLWKGGYSSTDIESLRFKQGLGDLPFTTPFDFLEAGHSEATMAHLFLNELRVVAAQNQSIYERLNDTIVRHRDKAGFIQDIRPDLPALNRSRPLNFGYYGWPEGWSSVVLSPWSRVESQWFLKQAHELRDPVRNDIHSLWQTGKIRTLTTPVRESTQKSIFRIRLPFVQRTKVHPVTIGRAWKKVNVMDTKLNAFGLVTNRAHFYPHQLKLRLQNERGAKPTANLRLTPSELEMQRNMNHSIRFWWGEAEQSLIPLMNPVGTQPWNLFEGFVATPQLTSETQSLTVNLVNGSLVLLHIALLSFLIQVPEVRTFLKFYTLVLSRLVTGYLWALKMSTYLIQECRYEIQHALYYGDTLMFPLRKTVTFRAFTRPMLYKQLHRCELNPRIDNPYDVVRRMASAKGEKVTRLEKKNAKVLSLADICLNYSNVLHKKDTIAERLLNERELAEEKAKLERQFANSPSVEEPRRWDYIVDDEDDSVKEWRRYELKLKSSSFLLAAREGYSTFLPPEKIRKNLQPDMSRSSKPTWAYDVATMPLTSQTDELSLRLMEAEEDWNSWTYEVLYMQERHKAYKTALAVESVPESQLYKQLYKQALLRQLFFREAFNHKAYRVTAKFTIAMIGLYTIISRKYSQFYDAVDKGIALTRRAGLQFMEEPGENAMEALNKYFLIAFMSDLLTERTDEAETLQSLFIEYYTRQANALGPVGSLIQRRLHRLAEDFYIAWTRPDKDLFMRQQKSLIFWNMWGALLIRAVARYQLSLADLIETKEEQEKLVECLITESDWSWTQQSLIQFQPLFDLFSIGKRSWKDFTVPTASPELVEPPMLETVFQPQDPSQPFIQQNGTTLKTFESTNLADSLYKDSHATTVDELSWRWGAQQFNIYHSRVSTLGVEYQPPGNLGSVPQLKYYTSMHTQLGWVIQDNLRTTFTQTPSKNALIVGPPGPEVTSLIRALVGELEMKLVTDNARRYTTVIKNVAIGVRHLKQVFYSVSVEAPCLFVLEDIHLIGRRRDLMIAEDEELYFFELEMVTTKTNEFEDEYTMNRYIKHTGLHYEKPFRGDYSFLIPTNCFAFDYFREPAPSRMRRFGTFKKSPYELQAIEQELIKLRGLENLSNIQSKSPPLSLTTAMQARKAPKQVKAAPNSPLTVAIEKNRKAFRPRRIVKNMPLKGISWDMWMLLSRYDYSIRSKVALLAVLTEDAIGEVTDMITDLLVMMDTVRATRGLIMFATTHSPTALDPALRRPGRLDETLSVPLFSSVMTRWEILKLRYSNRDQLEDLMPYANVTLNLSNSEVHALTMKSLVAVIPKSGSTKRVGKAFHSLKAKMHMSYFEAFLQSKSFGRLKEQLNDLVHVPSNTVALDIQMRQRKLQTKVNTLAYTLVGAHLIRWKAQVVTYGMDADILAYTVEKIHPLLKRLERQHQFLDLDVARLRDATTVREHLTNSLAPRFAETFFTSSLLNPPSVVNLDKDLATSQVTFQLREKTNYVPLTFEKFELAATRFKPNVNSFFSSLVPSFRNSILNLGVPASRTSEFISSVVQKRSIWTKNLVVYRLLYVPNNQDYRESPAWPMYEVEDPYKNYETYRKEHRVLYRSGNLTMNEKLEIHKTYRLYLAVANRTIEDLLGPQNTPEEEKLLKRHVLPSLEELSSLALVMNHPSGTNKFYRQNTHLRQRFHLIDQWWNGQLADLDVERTLQSEVETRVFFVPSLNNDLDIDYPLSDRYYNVRSRRWVSKQGVESWFDKGAKYNDAAAYHYMVCALTRCYEQLHKNRESLDQLAYTFLNSGQVSEVQTHGHYTRFYQTDV